MDLRSALVVSLLTVACGGSQAARATYRYAANDPATMTAVDIRPGPMPDGESFSGSFSSQQIGDVFLEQTGDSVVGEYHYNRANCRASGHIEGSAQGNLLRFTWTESQSECGRLGTLRGHGWFLFWKDSANNGRFNGEWGQGDSDTGGGPWSGFRDRVRRQPPASDRTPSAVPTPGPGVFNDSPAPASGASPR